MVESQTREGAAEASTRTSTQSRQTNIMELAQNYDNFLFDCDGVLWSAESQIGTAFETLEELERMGKKVFFITNNATKLTEDMAAKMTRMGYNNIKLNQIYTTGALVSKYIRRKYPDIRKVFAIGVQSIRKSLESEGIEVVGAD